MFRYFLINITNISISIIVNTIFSKEKVCCDDYIAGSWYTDGSKYENQRFSYTGLCRKRLKHRPISHSRWSRHEGKFESELSNYLFTAVSQAKLAICRGIEMEVNIMNDSEFGVALARNALDEIPQPSGNAKDIVGLVKSSGKITGYQLSNGQTVSKEEGVAMAKVGEIKGVGVSHRGDTEYLKSLPDGTEDNNLGNLPSISG